jgi:hypothetical protein
LFLALLPVLILGVLQSVFAFKAEADSRRQSLELAAGRSAAIARARIEAAGVLLQTLGPGSVGLECTQRLDTVKQRLPGYANLIRFDAYGRVSCAAATTPPDAVRANRRWFQRLAGGSHMVVASIPGRAYADEPAVLTAVRAESATAVRRGHGRRADPVHHPARDRQPLSAGRGRGGPGRLRGPCLRGDQPRAFGAPSRTLACPGGQERLHALVGAATPTTVPRLLGRAAGRRGGVRHPVGQGPAWPPGPG